MMPRTMFALVLGVVGCLSPQNGAAAQEKNEKKPAASKEVVVKDELIAADLKDKVLTESYSKTYNYKMTQGKTYQIDMISAAFDAYLRLETSTGDQVAADDDGGGMLNARIIYRAAKTDEFQIYATSLGTATGKFTLIVKELPIAAVKAIELKNDKGSASVTVNLAQNDPKYNNKAHKLILFPVEAGKTYQIDMKSQNFDSYLFLEDPEGILLAQDDDGGGFPNARIVFKAAKAGKHRIMATHFGNVGNGEFTLTIRQTDGGGAAPDEKKEIDNK